MSNYDHSHAINANTIINIIIMIILSRNCEVDSGEWVAQEIGNEWKMEKYEFLSKTKNMYKSSIVPVVSSPTSISVSILFACRMTVRPYGEWQAQLHTAQSAPTGEECMYVFINSTSFRTETTAKHRVASKYSAQHAI